MESSLTKILYNYDTLENISDIVRFRDDIKKFKIENWNLVEQFYNLAEEGYRHDKNSSPVTYRRFLPRNDKLDERRNVGIYSTAVCLETIIQYDEEVKKNKNKIEYFQPKFSEQYYLFIVRGLTHRLHNQNDKDCTNEPVTQPRLLSKINTLIRFFPFYDKYIKDNEDSKKDNDITKKDNDIKREDIYLKKIFIDILIEFQTSILDKIDNSHPYVLYKFLQLMELWINFIDDAIDEVVKNPNNNSSSEYAKIMHLNEFEISNLNIIHKEAKNKYKKYFFNKIYLHAKYELYRQMALKLSGDMALFDVKRLIYSLLIVYVDDKFSNNLVREKALSLIFQAQKKDPNALWPTGQLLHISKDSSDYITTVECVYDLLDGPFDRELLRSVSKFLPELKNIFHTVIRTAQIDADKKVTGWYPLAHRDKTPTSWISALTLLFIKRFCQLVSLEILKRAQNFFIMNYRTPNIKWENLFDSTAAKSKLRLMFDEEKTGETTKIRYKEKTAMFFGPPGTGKTTFARALATKLDWKYLELTPGDFYSGGESEILPKINDIFYHLQLLKETVVFIDEIDDLVISRDQKAYDPRTLYVNTLLPRFQDIHDNGNIILIASTNHINKVDEAIARLGRFDLIIPIGPMSIHGRIDLFINEFFMKYIVNKEIKIKNGCFLASMEKFVDCTQYYTYSQIKIFITELIKLSQRNQPFFPSKHDIGSIKDQLGFQENRIYLDSDKKSVIINRLESSTMKIRPFSMHDIDDVNVKDFRLERPPNSKKLIHKAITSELVIKLYVFLYELKNENTVLHYMNKKITNKKTIISQTIKMLDVFYQLSDKYKSHYYCIVTPFFDTLEYLCCKKEDPIKELKRSYETLRDIIKCRSLS